MTFMFLIRYLLDMPAQKPWDRFLHSDVKFNKRMINRYTRVDRRIFDHSDKFNDLPEVFDASKSKKKKRKVINLSIAVSDSPIKRRFTCRDSSTEEEE